MLLLLNNKYADLYKKYKDSSDYPFMKGCIETLDDLPATWKQYPDTIDGAINILKMEYNEALQASSTSKTSHELIHLASACLHLWRKLNV